MINPPTPALQAFGRDLNPDVELQASTLTRPVSGADIVARVLAAAGEIYESLTITHETVNGRRAYLETQATAFGGQQLHGVVVLTTDHEGAVDTIAIHHRPLGAVRAFSTAMAERLGETLNPDYFHTPSSPSS